MIANNQVVSLDYTIKDDKNNTLETSTKGPLIYIHGHRQLPPAIEKALEGKVQGENVSVSFKPGECFGKYDEKLVTKVDAEVFGKDIEVKVGIAFENKAENGSQIMRVTKVEGNKVTVDGNHPYSNLKVTWDLSVLSFRPASEGELQQVYSQGGGCCDEDSSCCAPEPEAKVEEPSSEGGCCGSC